MYLGDVFSTFHDHFNVQYFLVDCYSIEFHFEMPLLQTIFRWWPFSSDLMVRVGSSNVFRLCSRLNVV